MTIVASSASDRRGVAEMLAGAVPALLFGLRVAGAVSLALFVAFYLQLETPSWAGTSACVVCQTVVGSSLLKGVFRMIGTAIGAVVAMVLTGAFPQDRAGFLFAMLLWASACSLVATALRNVFRECFSHEGHGVTSGDLDCCERSRIESTMSGMSVYSSNHRGTIPSC